MGIDSMMYNQRGVWFFLIMKVFGGRNPVLVTTVGIYIELRYIVRFEHLPVSILI